MINDLIDAGKRLLQDRPMCEADYFRWSDTARGKIAEHFGDTPQAQEFFKARWEIATTLDADPSSYLTQIGANLRRELRILEKLQRQ